MQGYLALCLAVKDQTADMPEWLDWHAKSGVARFYIFDMASAVPMNSSLQVTLQNSWSQAARRSHQPAV